MNFFEILQIFTGFFGLVKCDSPYVGVSNFAFETPPHPLHKQNHRHRRWFCLCKRKGARRSLCVFHINVVKVFEEGVGGAFFKKTLPQNSSNHHAQDMVVGFSSVMIMSLRKATALRSPSSMVIRLSSCSMERTRS